MASHDELPLPRPPAPAGAARKTRVRALLFMVLSLTAGLGAAWMINRYLGQRAAASARGELVPIAVAAMDVPLGTALRDEMVSYADWPAQALPRGAFRRGESLAGRVVSKDFSQGEPFVASRVAASASGVGMAAVVPSELRAMTVRVNEVIGVSGFIHPNDVVDVITTMRTDLPGEKRQDFRSKIVLQKVKVLAVGQQMDTQSDKPVKVPVVTLLVTPDDSERLALASTEGKIQLTLRSRADASEVETAGVSPPELFGDTDEDAPPPAPPAAVAKAPAPAPLHHARLAKHEAVAAKPAPEVVEVLRGDRYEERKIRAKDDQP